MLYKLNFTIQFMSKYLTILAIIAFFASCQSERIEIINEENSSTYDSTLAHELGADNYGMKTYVIAFLKSGNKKAKDSAHSAELMKAHLANINKMAEKGQLVIAGPFFGSDSLRGIYIFDTKSIDSAKAWTATDPAIKYGTLKMELKKWYGSAALMKVNEIHKGIAKKSI